MTSNQPITILPEKIDNRIYTIRRLKIMLDTDLAVFYQIPVKRLNEQVKRNLDRFPEDFMFQLTHQEVDNLRSQIATSSLADTHGGRRYLPYVFTEHGILMLSSVLNSERATKVNIAIMRAFVELRQAAMSDNRIERELHYIANTLTDHDEKIKALFMLIDELAMTTESAPPSKSQYSSNKIGFIRSEKAKKK